MKMSKVKSADSVVHQFLRVLSKPSQAPKCHWSNCDCPKNPKAANCAPSADGNVTRHQTLHHPCYTSNSFSSNLFTHKKQMTQIKASEDPEKGGRKKKNKDEKKKIRLSTEETGKWLTSWAYVLIQTHCPCCTITIHLTDILVGWFVLEYQDRLGDAELQQAITQGYHNTK